MLTFNNTALSGGYNSYSDYYDGFGDYYGTSSSATLRTPQFVIFASCWTLLFILYLFLTSATAYTRTDRPIGRFFNRSIAFAVDLLSAVFWFAGFVALALFCGSGPCNDGPIGVCATTITSTLLGVCIWYDSCSPFTLRNKC